MGRNKSSDHNMWKPPVQGLDFDAEGPTADHLIDTSHIYDQVVYKDIHPLRQEWSVLDQDEAKDYLPTRKEPLNVMVGIEEKKTQTLNTWESIKLEDHFEFKKGYIINTGGNIWGLDFVPKSGINDTDPTRQYLAVSGYRGAVEEHINIGSIQPTGSYKNAIQIWKLKLSVQPPQEDAVLDMCILHDFGVVYDLKWCPYGTYETEGSDDSELYKLGILTFACGDGTIRTLIVPHPDAVRKYMCPDDPDSTKPVYLRADSARCTFQLKTSYATKISWGGHKKIVASSSTGGVNVWNMESALNDKNSHLVDRSRRHLTFSCMSLDSAARDITWNGIFEPERIAVCGMDGNLNVIDSNDPFISLGVARIRGIYGACAWAGHNNIIISTDADCVNRGITFNMDGSLTKFKYGICPGFTWSIGVSEHHGQFALGTSLGWVRSSNVYTVKMRGHNVSQHIVYKLHYNQDDNLYRYIDGLLPQSLDEAKELPTYRQYGDTQMAIQRVVWNPNKQTSAFLASGGAAGLCRIEFEGRGSKWT